MNINKLQRKIRVAGVAFSLLFGIGILSATTANAQNRDNRRDNDQNSRRKDRDKNDRDYDNRNNRDDNDRDYNDRDDRDNNDRDYNNQNNNDRDYNNRNNQNRYIAQQAYRNGMSQGIEDARNGRRANAQRAAGQAMRQMNNGNNSRWGNQNNFRQVYREAFIRGYNEGYNRNYNRNDRWNNNRNRRNGY